MDPGLKKINVKVFRISSSPMYNTIYFGRYRIDLGLLDYVLDKIDVMPFKKYSIEVLIKLLKTYKPNPADCKDLSFYVTLPKTTPKNIPQRKIQNLIKGCFSDVYITVENESLDYLISDRKLTFMNEVEIPTDKMIKQIEELIYTEVAYGGNIMLLWALLFPETQVI